MRLKNIRVSTILFLCLMMVTFGLLAQPTNPSRDPDTVPITGLEILLTGGALLGLKRLIGKKKEH